MGEPRNVFLTDLRGFANPVIAEKLRAAGARVIACDPGIGSDGQERGIEVIGWASPADLVIRATQRFSGRLDDVLISSAMPAACLNVEDLTVAILMHYFLRVAAE